MTVPAQKPGKSEQSVETPNEFIDAAKRLLHIEQFDWDLAADESNTKAKYWTPIECDALIQAWDHLGGWLWLNPPYSKITPWVTKCWKESREGACIAALVPASVGSNWWNDYVAGKAQVYFLTPRITFMGHKHPYPKDLALLLYRPDVTAGYSTWHWKSSAKVAYTPNQHGEPVLSVAG